MGAKGLRKILKAGWCLMHTGLGFLIACGGTLATLLDIFSHADARWLRDEFSELGLLMHQNSHTCDYYLREVAGAKHVCKPVDTSIGVLDSMYSWPLQLGSWSHEWTTGSCLEPWDPWTMMWLCVALFQPTVMQAYLGDLGGLITKEKQTYCITSTAMP